MKKFWTALTIAVLGVTVAVSSAEAKRLGGGGSFGKSSPTFSRQAPMQNTNQAATAPRPAQPAAWSGAQQPAVPADFDVNGFLRHAKTNFIRMQAAWDRADVNDILEFTTPEMFGELKMQLTERGAAANQTDVVSIEAEMLGVESNGHEHIASVRFHGMIREAKDAVAEPFSEIWVLTKPVSGNQGWLLAGVQQA